MADKKFVSLHESYMRRYERGGFLVGDVFKFNDNFKNSDEFKSLGTNTQELLQQMIDSGQHVRVVALDDGGGRYSHHVSIPSNLGQSEEFYPNLPPVPDVFKRKSDVVIKPEEAETTQAPEARDGNTERELPDSNTTIPSDSASYTQQYLGDLTKGPSAY